MVPEIEKIPTVEEMVSNYLDQKYNDEDEFWGREIGVYHASDFGKCLRMLYYEHDLGKRQDESSYPHFHLGHQVEGFIEKVLKNNYGNDRIKNSYRIALEYGDFKIVGQTDPVLVSENGKIEKLFEVKSAKDISYREESPSEHHTMQVHPYMKALDLKGCEIIYVQKNDLEVLSHDIWFDSETFEYGLNRIKKLHDCLQEKREPEAKPFKSWQCKVCNYSEECSNGGE